jgi:hypothetical protein
MTVSKLIPEEILIRRLPDVWLYFDEKVMGFINRNLNARRRHFTNTVSVNFSKNIQIFFIPFFKILNKVKLIFAPATLMYDGNLILNF